MEENKELVDLAMKILRLPEEKREAVIRILTKYPKQKVILALNNAYRVTKHGKSKPTVTLEEFEEIVRKTRF